ncbi:METTL5 family protein [Methanomassiliicoccus luminyensis]|jgi:putative methylase|uniref:METTL5 family protein n=1 Tax=Methanomassiliicoccus luminyensis TaxID=1080712 RepID=UPI00037094C5|nr:METTL5 family protein [Methanomassiliicoccus luminyensis]
MKKNELERLLQKVPPHSVPKAGLEQYSTPAAIAADVLYTAYSFGDIAGRSVADLGCGSGIFSIGAWALGASKVTGVDVDHAAIEDAARNISAFGAEVVLVESDVRDVDLRADTVVMNPPFGSQKKHADRPFLEAAVRTAPRVYSLHNAGTVEFLNVMLRSLGAEVFCQKSYKLQIPHMFDFHDRKKKDIEVALLCISSDVTK